MLSYEGFLCIQAMWRGLGIIIGGIPLYAGNVERAVDYPLSVFRVGDYHRRDSSVYRH